MNQAINFLHQWGAANVQPMAVDGMQAESERLAAQCVADAVLQGLSEEDLEIAAGQDLVSYMLDLVDNANFAEVERITSSKEE